DAQHQPISVKACAGEGRGRSPSACRRRRGKPSLARGNRGLALLALCPAAGAAGAFSPRAWPVGHRDNLLTEPRAEEWLLIEWPQDESEPTKYWFSTPAFAGAGSCPRISLSIVWSTRQNCERGSSAIIRSSNRNSASVIMKGAGGTASTITPHSASPPTA